MSEIFESPCRECLETVLTNYIKLLDMDKILNARLKALENQSCETVSIEMPMILGAKGYVNYVYDFTEQK